MLKIIGTEEEIEQLKAAFDYGCPFAKKYCEEYTDENTGERCCHDCEYDNIDYEVEDTK